MFYLVKTPLLVKKFYPSYLWSVPTREKLLYLTFDDGPHPAVTPFVLDQLKKYNARATFFCVGENVKSYPNIYNQTLADQHAVGNHTFTHINGGNSATDQYVNNVQQASQYINSSLFRPPYGRIKRAQATALMNKPFHFKIIMWDVLSGDFDINITPETCIRYVLKNATHGSIVVFHDSEKAFQRLKIALPAVLNYFQKNGFNMRALLL